MIATNSREFFEYIKPYKSRENVQLLCPGCNYTFMRSKNVIQSKLGNHNNEQTIYCSRKCFEINLITKQNVNCLQCDKDFEKHPNQILKYPNHFCSRSCAAKYNNTHKTKGSRRSKLEIWLESKLNNIFTTFEIRYNRKDTANTELDIYIPMLKLAFELNGIFHYEPIYGQDKLLSIQNNDGRKFQACLEHNIELVIIDTSGQKYFKETSSQKYLDIIINIINTKLSERAKGLEPSVILPWQGSAVATVPHSHNKF